MVTLGTGGMGGMGGNWASAVPATTSRAASAAAVREKPCHALEFFISGPPMYGRYTLNPERAQDACMLHLRSSSSERCDETEAHDTLFEGIELNIRAGVR